MLHVAEELIYARFSSSICSIPMKPGMKNKPTYILKMLKEIN